MWFDSWSTVVRILLVGAASYATLVLLLRISGKRTLAKLNAFDFVVTVALGSVLASAVLSSDVPWSDALTAMVVLIGAQLLVARVTAWLPQGRSIVNAEPTLLVRHGTVLEDALRSSRLTQDELRQATRSSGSGALDQLAAVVLEADGTLSVIEESTVGDGWALEGVRGWQA